MKVYWDTSAIVRYLVQRRLEEITGVTRTHTLAELYSTLSGRGVPTVKADGTVQQKRLSMRLAAAVVDKMHAQLEFVDLTTAEVVACIREARTVGAQGARVHDLLHAAAADKANADELWTLDRNDFNGLGRVPVKQL